MKFQTKITICVILILAVIFGVGNCIQLNRSFESSVIREQKNIYATYQMLIYALDAIDVTDTPTSYANMHNAIYQLDAQGGRWLALRLKCGNRVIYNSQGEVPFLNELEKKTALNQCSMQTFLQGEDWYLQLTGRFLLGSSSYMLDAIYPLQELYQTREIQLHNYYLAFVSIILLGTLMSWVISRWLTGPLETLSLVMRRITAGELTYRAPITTGDEVGALARDLNHMTDQLESSIAQMRETLRRQEEFMGNFSHELKTPMTAIIGYADLLRSQTLSQEEQQAAANYIFHEGRRLERLSIKLLELFVARQGEIDPVRCCPRTILEAVAQTLEPALEKEGISFQMHCADGICCLDPDLLYSLLKNLIDNARKAIDGKGLITVTGEVTEEWVRFTVKDTGCGMSQEELQHICEPFYRVDKSRSRMQGGVGLGLSMCNEIARLHHGSIEFESAPDQGTVVTVLLRGEEPCGHQDR